jgi:RES domain-containing protein
MLGTRDPMISNERGARWNPPNVPTLYASLDRDTAIAEGDHLIALQGRPLKTVRSIHTIGVELHNVLELTDEHLLETLGLPPSTRESDDHGPCRIVGGAAEWLGHDGILVPSARCSGTNVAIYVAKMRPTARLEVIKHEAL